MATAEAGVSTRTGGLSKDERFVIVASSTGTIFEWYDFYLYATLAVLCGPVLPARQRYRRFALRLRHLRRGLPGPAVWCRRLRPHRRSGRPQIHLPRHRRG